MSKKSVVVYEVGGEIEIAKRLYKLPSEEMNLKQFVQMSNLTDDLDLGADISISSVTIKIVQSDNFTKVLNLVLRPVGHKKEITKKESELIGTSQLIVIVNVFFTCNATSIASFVGQAEMSKVIQARTQEMIDQQIDQATNAE